MKRNSLTFAYAVFLTGCITVFIIQGCTKVPIGKGVEPLADAISNIDSVPLAETLPTWQSKLDYVMKGVGAAHLNNHGLTLLSYGVRKNINTDSLKACRVDEKALVPVYSRTSENLNKFSVVRMFDVIPTSRDVYAKRKKLQVNGFESDGLIPVTLNWTYNGSQFSTVSLVSLKKQTIVYDDILSNILILQISKTPSITKSGLVPMIQSLGESGTDGPVQYNFFSNTYTYYSVLGFLLAQAYWTLIVKGTRTNDVISLTTYSQQGYHNAEDGYSAGAQATINFVPGTNGHLEYAYGVFVATSANLSLGYNGTTYSIPGGSVGETGGQYIIPSMLH